MVTERIHVVYASPGGETELRCGFGFDWRFSDRFAVELGYRRHDTRVLDIEAVTVQLVVSL